MSERVSIDLGNDGHVGIGAFRVLESFAAGADEEILEGVRPCGGCGQGIVPGHAYEVTDDGLMHVDCDDKWLGYFDDEVFE